MQKYYPGAVVEGTVVGIKPYGAFIEIENGIECYYAIEENASPFFTKKILSIVTLPLYALFVF